MAEKKDPVCTCCRRAFKSESPAGLCWECSNRPVSAAYIPPPRGKRAESCPHDVPR